MEYVIIRNNKAPVKSVFEAIEAPGLKNPNEKQKFMLSMICDGVEFLEYNIFDAPSIKTILKTKMKENDYLYSILSNGTLHLEGIHTGKIKYKKLHEKTD